MHGLYGLLWFFLEGELVGIEFKPRIEFDNEIALIDLVLEVMLNIVVCFARQCVVAAQVVVELLEDHIELLFEVLRLLHLRRLGVLELR